MAHNNTLFHSMLNFIPRHQFSSLENQHTTGRKKISKLQSMEPVCTPYVYATNRQSKPSRWHSVNELKSQKYVPCGCKARITIHLC